MKKNHLLFLFIAVLPLLFSSVADVRSRDEQTLNEDLVFLPDDFAAWQGDSFALSASGLALTDSMLGSTITSPPIKAPFPFNAVVPQWLADLPQDTNLELQLRSSDNGTVWGDWRELHASPDMNPPESEQIVGDMFFVPDSKGTQPFVQVMITLSRVQKQVDPQLRELRLTFIDSTAGPTTEQLIAIQQALDQRNGAEQDEVETGYPKPFVISRAVWCTDPACNYSEGLAYQTVTHLVLHHTVGIPDGDSAAQMRAYWSYHTYTKGWGDIGYNFVIDLHGNIFEGHRGGDDVIGTHASGANAGSMGLAMIGTYSVAEPAAAVKESIIDMFAWKAEQKEIDVFGASATLPNMDWGLPHVMGHRDVYGTTECPGGAAHKLIPAIRDEVASRLGQQSSHIYVDELSASFLKSNANWYTADSQCGHNTHAFYTWSTTDPALAVNWGEWRPDVPVTGRYQIEAYIPYCRTLRSETEGAHYTIHHAAGTDDVVVSQEANLGLWAPLGEYTLLAGNETVVHLTDLTTTDDGLGVWFDALRLLPVEPVPAAVILAPNDATWLNDHEVTFNWQIENPAEVSQTTLQIATDEQFQDVVATTTWPGAVENVSQTFDRDYGALYWRVVLRSTASIDYTSSPVHFGIDTEPPISSVKTVTWLAWEKRYRVTWHGSDAMNPIASYNIMVREPDGEDPAWQPWLSGTSSTTAYFSPPVAGEIYEFRSQATDSLGNVEPEHTEADVSTEQAKILSHVIILPLIQ